jgi:hypothetical protein
MKHVCNFLCREFLLILLQVLFPSVLFPRPGLDRRETGLFYSTVYLMNFLYRKYMPEVHLVQILNPYSSELHVVQAHWMT